MQRHGNSIYKYKRHERAIWKGGSLDVKMFLKFTYFISVSEAIEPCVCMVIASWV